MSCYALRYAQHLLETSCAKQSCVALSSGEAEYYALTRAASAGLLLKNVLEEIQRETEMICLTDSSAAKGITARHGVGRVKHLSLKELWVQDMVAKKTFKFQKESTETNWADIGTKVLDAARISRLVEMMPLKRGIIAASLLTLGKCQGPEEYDTDEDGSWPFWLYFLLMHLFALFGLIAFCMRAYESFTNRNRLKEMIDERCESEGEKDESDDNGTGTEIPGPTVAQEPAMSSLGMEVKASGNEHSKPAALIQDGSQGLRERREPVNEFVLGSGQGVKYHRLNCGIANANVNRRRVREIRRSAALNAGCQPCKQCCPR